jgi:Gpi18-like mannosyltransferase
MLKKLNKMAVLFFIALTLRLGLVFTAYHGDLNNNISWGTLAVERGLSGFYGSSDADDWEYSAPNQPPLSILMFAGVRVVWQVVENVSWWLNNNISIFPSPFIWFWEGRGMILLIKLPGILADLGVGFLIYRYFEKRGKKKIGAGLSGLWLFNPIVWYNSTIWGQTDSVVNLLGLLGLLGLLRKNLAQFSIWFTLSFLFKGSLAIFIPILGFVAVWQKHPLKEWLHAVCYALLAIILVSVWFHPQLNLLSWLINLYRNRILPGEIGYLTANAFNFWWLVDSGKVWDSTLYFGLPARIWGFVLTLGGIGGIVYWLRKKVTNKRIFVSLMFVSLISFLFMTRIHERYLYPFFPYATLLLGTVSGLFVPYLVLTITHLLNLYHLFWFPPLAPLEAMYQWPWLMQLISVVNIFIFLYLLRLLRRAKI